MARYVAPIFPPIPDPFDGDYLSLLSNEHLLTTQTMVQLTCNRSRTPTHARASRYVCNLSALLSAEGKRRGILPE